MPATDLIISEMIEGSSQNKAVEIYNPTGEPISLNGYILQFYFNGSTTAGLTITLTTTVILQPGQTYVIAQSSADPAILAQADQLSTATNWYNGDDAIVLRHNGAVVDSIGQIGFDPGTEWGSGLTSTADNTLVRRSGVVEGDTNPNDAFVPSAQWDGFAQNSFANLGTHSTAATYSITPLAADQSEGDNGSTAFTFTVTRPSGTAAESISYTVSGINAGPADADPADFAGGALPSGTIDFAVGETSRTLTIYVAGETVAEIDEGFTVTLGVEDSPFAIGTIRNDDVVEAQISDIQGAGHRSPLEGLAVATTGIVTAVTSNGFWIQDPSPDGDSRTSEAVFVFTRSTPPATMVPGTEVRVTGTVTEFFGNSQSTAELSLTEITVTSASAIQVIGTGTIDATIIGAGGLMPPTENYGDDDNVFDPATEGLDFWESVEGMVVTLNGATATGPSDRDPVFDDSEVFVTLEGIGAGLRTPNGGLIVQEGDFNPERIAIQEDDRIFDNPFEANVGDSLGDVTGIVTYDSSGYYEVIPTEAFVVTPGGIARETGTDLAPASDQLTIASYNAENLSLRDLDAKFLAIAEQIVNGLNGPDIIALQEVQDDTGSTNNGVVTSDATLAKLIAAIESLGGPSYQYAYITPVNNQDGGQTGGNIRQVFLYNPERVQLADSTVGSATVGVTVANDGGTPDLSASVSRIDPTDPAFTASRKPLVAEFVFNGESVIVINNHFSSKIGDDPLFGTNQPPVEETEAQRIAQAQIVADFIAEILAIDPDANIAVVGDLNDFPFSTSLQTLEGSGLSNLSDLLPENERYDYVFQGNSQQLDHILVSANLGEEAAFDILRINAEFAVQTSDHDPLIARLNIAAGLELSGGNGNDLIEGGAGNDWIDGGNGDDRIEGGYGKDEIHGGRGNDILIGGNAGDSLYGESGNDLLDGGAGFDFLSGGAGDDRLIGGDGEDTFYFARSGGNDTVVDFDAAADVLLFGQGVAIRSAAVGDVDGDGLNDTVLALTGGGSVTLLGVDDYDAPAAGSLSVGGWQVRLGLNDQAGLRADYLI